MTGHVVVLVEPLRWGMRLALIDIELVCRGSRWSIVSLGSRLLNANAVPEDPHVAALLKADHQQVVSYVNSPIGTATVAMSAATAR